EPRWLASPASTTRRVRTSTAGWPGASRSAASARAGSASRPTAASGSCAPTTTGCARYAACGGRSTRSSSPPAGATAPPLRRARDGAEYTGVRPVRGTTSLGTLPSCTLRFDDDLPVCASLPAFTPHLPHDVRESTLPAAVFRFTLENPGRAAV